MPNFPEAAKLRRGSPPKRERRATRPERKKTEHTVATPLQIGGGFPAATHHQLTKWSCHMDERATMVGLKGLDPDTKHDQKASEKQRPQCFLALFRASAAARGFAAR